jgi:hypothetical protein
MRGLFMQQIGDFAGLVMKLILFIANVFDTGPRDIVDAAHLFGEFILIGQSHLATNHHAIGCCKGFTGHAGQRVFGQKGVENSIRDTVTNFIGMPL